MKRYPETPVLVEVELKTSKLGKDEVAVWIKPSKLKGNKFKAKVIVEDLE